MTETIDLKVGDQIKLDHDNDPSKWWTVQVLDERYAIAIRQRPFRKKGALVYTILDFEDGVRGPCNLIGQAWPIKGETAAADAAKLLEALNAKIEYTSPLGQTGRRIRLTETVHVEISHRNRVPLRILERKGDAK